jgi:hypothetical protein
MVQSFLVYFPLNTLNNMVSSTRNVPGNDYSRNVSCARNWVFTNSKVRLPLSRNIVTYLFTI